MEKKKPTIRINAKAKGSRRELKTKHRLEDSGYTGVKAGGRLGEFDLVMMRPGSLRLIQVKSNRRPPPIEMEAIREFHLKTGDTLTVTKEAWIWKDYQRAPIIEEVP